jgi:3-isopropylmalate dehydrogenase
MVQIAVIPGDGIGQEVIPEACRALAAVDQRWKLDLSFHHYPLGADHYLATGQAMPQAVFEELRDHRQAIFLGALGDPRVPDSAHARDILLGLRRRLDLFINFRPTSLMDLRFCPLKLTSKEQVNFVIFRENTEGLYSGAGGAVHKGTSDEVATEVMIYSYMAVERIQRAAFAYAAQRGLRLCMVDKSNALRHVGDLWLRVFKDMKAEFPSVQTQHLYVDAAAMEIIRDPAQFDVIVTSNLFGDILSDLAAMLAGGMGMAASANLHPGRVGLFEPVHGSAPDIAGRNIANPTAALLTAALMLDQLGFVAPGQALEAATSAAILDGDCTRDLGGNLSTTEMVDAVIRRIPAQGA